MLYGNGSNAGAVKILADYREPLCYAAPDALRTIVITCHGSPNGEPCIVVRIARITRIYRERQLWVHKDD
jgi:hypothetical protein